MAGIILSLIAGFAPMLLYSWFLYSLDRYEKEPFRILAAVFCWGAVIAAGGAFLINTTTNLGFYLLFQSESAAMLTTTTLVAPVVEESLKGFAVLLVFLFFREEFDSLLDGILFAAITALGFAATENSWYIYNLGYLPGNWSGFLNIFSVRTFWVGWQHPFYTAFLGLGLAYFRLNSRHKHRWIFPFFGFSAAVFLHSLHNLLGYLFYDDPGLLFSRAWDWTGYLGLLIFIFAVNQREKRWLKNYLADEVDKNTLTKSQLNNLIRNRNQLTGSRKQPSRETQMLVKNFVHLAGELMHKKRQKSENITNPNIDKTIDQLQINVRKLSKQLKFIETTHSQTANPGKEPPNEQPVRKIPLSPGKDEHQDF